MTPDSSVPLVAVPLTESQEEAVDWSTPHRPPPQSIVMNKAGEVSSEVLILIYVTNLKKKVAGEIF